MTDFSQNDGLNIHPNEVQEYCETLNTADPCFSEFMQNQFVTDEKSPVSYARMISGLDSPDIEFHKNQFVSDSDQDITSAASVKTRAQTMLSNSLLKQTFPPLRDTLLMKHRVHIPDQVPDDVPERECNCSEISIGLKESVSQVEKPRDTVIENSPELSRYTPVEKNLLFGKSGPYRNLRESLSGAEKVSTPAMEIESAQVTELPANPLKELAATLQGLLPSAPKKVTISLTYEL